MNRKQPNTVALLPDDTAVVADLCKVDLDDFFRHHSRTFSFAAKLFTTEQQWVVKRIYAFCRLTDDIVDKPESRSREQTTSLLDAWEHTVVNAFGGRASGIAWLDELLMTSHERGVPIEIIRDLIQGVRSDASNVRFDDQQALLGYCYKVASTVGLWMCHMLGITREADLSCAIALGKALQLTNIVRDVGEDLSTGRVYLPEDMMAEYGLNVDTLIEMSKSKKISNQYSELIADLIALSEEYYRNAWQAIVRLPFRLGIGVAVASVTYQRINHHVIKNNYDNLSLRAYTSRFEKIYLTGVAFSRYVTGRYLNVGHNTGSRSREVMF